MELSRIVGNQVLIIFGLIFIGFVLTKLKMLTQKGADELTTVLLYVVTPCVLLNAYRKEFSVSESKQLALAALFTFIIHIIAIIIATLVFIKKDEKLHYRVNIFSTIYSNCGFMAIPLLSEALGNQGVFYGSMYLAIFTVIYWIHGVYCCTGGDKSQISFKKCFINPGFIGTAVSIILFVSGFWFWDFPAPAGAAVNMVSSVITYMADLNTPLAMLVLGYYLANINFIKCLKKPTIYLVSFLRLVIIPVIGIYVAKLLGLDPVVAKAIIIPAACPTATLSTLFAARFKLDAQYASEIVSISTIISIITIPFIVMMA